MAGCDRVAPVQAPRPAEQRAELHVAVARDARAGRLAAEVGSEERPDDARLELAFQVEDVERDTELGRDAPSVLRRVGGATALLDLRVRVRSLVDPHPDADHLVAGFRHQRRRHGAVHPAGHRDQHPCHRS